MLANFRSPKILLLLILLILIIGALFYSNRQSGIKKEPPATPNAVQASPHQTTLEGEIICLPHRDTTGPQTLECAIGLQTNQGNYALDTNQTPELMTNLITGNHFKAEGLLTPIEYLSSDHWQKYNVQGIFSVYRALE